MMSGFIASDGYVLLHMPSHPHADANGNVREHRIKAELALGYILDRKHPVHHADEDTANNENCNLVVCENIRYHGLLHKRTNVLKAGGDPDKERWCTACKTVKIISEFNKDGYQLDGLSTYCRTCSQIKDRKWHSFNPEKVKAKHDSYHSRNREAINARKREMRAQGKWR